MLPSTFFLILGFFGFLHSWLNLWAEITRFPDRCFYSDWWNSIEFGSYYRKWNIIVHDWLYYFIYVDTCRFLKCGVKQTFVPKFLTFIISAVIHEVIITYALGFFYPILFILFTGPGTLYIIKVLFWFKMLKTSKVFQWTWHFGLKCTLEGHCCSLFTWWRVLPEREFQTNSSWENGEALVTSFQGLFIWDRKSDD